MPGSVSVQAWICTCTSRDMYMYSALRSQCVSSYRMVTFMINVLFTHPAVKYLIPANLMDCSLTLYYSFCLLTKLNLPLYKTKLNLPLYTTKINLFYTRLTKLILYKTKLNLPLYKTKLNLPLYKTKLNLFYTRLN